MVVDPGCMKCTDCVSVCPKGALRFGFGRPPLFKGRTAAPRREKRYPLSLGEELVVLALAVGATLAFRGLYDGPPLLMAVGLGGLTAFAAVKLWHLLRRQAVRVQNLRLKRDGALQPAGWLFAALGLAWLAFSAHSGVVQWHREWGRYYLDRTEAARADVLSGAFRNRSYSAGHEQAAARSRRHFELADRWGLVDVPEVKLGLAWGQLLAGDADAAEGRIRASIALAPERAQLHQNLVDLLVARGRLAEATEALERKLAAVAPEASDHFLLGGLLAESGRYREAVAQYRACLELAPGSAEARYNLGGLLRRMGRPDAAVEYLRGARDLAPDDVDTLIELGLACQEAGLLQEAIDSLREAVRLDPTSPESRLHLRNLIAELEGQVGGS
jgi:tetratricopeptide (TPR) repeat protein